MNADARWWKATVGFAGGVGMDIDIPVVSIPPGYPHPLGLPY